jgi:hypothetical protein
MRKKYDTSVIFLYAVGRENLLPSEFRNQIPYSTISTWRSLDYSKFFGHEFRYFFDEAFDKAEVVKENKKLRQIMFGIARSWLVLGSVLQPLIKNARKDRKIQKDIIDAIGFM